MISTPAFLTVRDLTKRYGPVEALRAINLDVLEGDVVAVLGPNGAGKTTFINLALGLLRPSGGEVRIAGLDPSLASRRGLVGAMLQETSLPSLVSARELVGHVSRFYPDPLPVDECLRQAGVEHLADRRLEKLSGGQRRRVAFALALVGRPRLLFLDEPTDGMDVEARRVFWEQMARWVAEHQATVCFSTHDLAEADRYARRIVVLHRGELALDGAPENLKTRLGSARVRFRAPPHETASTLESRLGVPVTPTDIPSHYEAWTTDTDTVLRRLTPDVEFGEFRTITETLDDVFRAVTNGTVGHAQGGSR